MKNFFLKYFANNDPAAAVAEEALTDVVPMPNSADAITPVEIGKDGWVRLSIYGEHDHSKGLQVVDRAAGIAMANSLKGVWGTAKKLLGSFLGVDPSPPVYLGHPDSPEHAASGDVDQNQYGRITEIEPRDDGIYGFVKWNDLGRQLLTTARRKLFYSPNWGTAKIPQRPGAYRPMKLKSAGLVPYPNLEDATAANSKPNRPPLTMKKYLTAILTALGIAEPQVSEAANSQSDGDPSAEILGHINTLKTAAARVPTLEADLTLANGNVTTADAARTKAESDLAAANAAKTKVDGELEQANGRLKAVSDAAVATVVDFAVAHGRISHADRGKWTDDLNKDFANAAKSLAGLKPNSALKTMSVTKGRGADRSLDVQNATDQLNQERDRLIEMSNGRLNSTTAWLQIKRDPKFAPLFEILALQGKAKEAAKK